MFHKSSAPLAPKASARVNDENANLALIEACRVSDVDLAARLLKSGADPNFIAQGIFGAETPLHYAWGRSTSRKLLELLLNNGANPNIRPEPNGLPLEVACAEGDREAAQLLLKYGANPNIKDNDGWTALMLACGGQDAVLVSKLLEVGADPNASDNEGWTALMNAAKTGNYDVVNLLLRAGADPKPIDNDGKSAASVASANGHSTLAATLQSACSQRLK